jgi:hypothetical protein
MAIGAISAMVVGLAGVVSAQEEAASRPATLELVSAGVIGEKDLGGVTLLKEGLRNDADEDVGTAVWQCSSAEAVAWVCTVYLELDPGTGTAAGSIVAEGRFEGFNGESFAITGGTGAYADARGDATLSADPDHFRWQLEFVG